ncbi:MAG: tol-pal system protein YbgF [Pseudolabrys sp.]
MLPFVGKRLLPVSSDMTRLQSTSKTAGLAAAFSLVLLAGSALAQEERGSGNFLDNLFSRGEPSAQSRQSAQPAPSGRVAQSDPGDLAVRLDRMENALRQLTGTIEQLQYRNQQLEMQIQQLGTRGGGVQPQAAPAGSGNAPPALNPGRRSDVFDPSQNPGAPGAPRTLGNQAVIAAPERMQDNAPPVGAPGGRAAGAPLDLSTMGDNDSPPQQAVPPRAVASASGAPVPVPPPMPAPMPPPQIRNVAPAPAGAQLATLPPSASAQDEYDMAYGYVLHKDYSLAEQSFRDFLKKYPNERLVPEAQYWLGESLFQQQRYRDAAESFLGVSTKFERTGKAPDALLRLGQSLAAMNQKEAACATLTEVGRKYPRASAGVKRGVEQELKRAHC